MQIILTYITGFLRGLGYDGDRPGPGFALGCRRCFSRSPAPSAGSSRRQLLGQRQQVGELLFLRVGARGQHLLQSPLHAVAQEELGIVFADYAKLVEVRENLFHGGRAGAFVRAARGVSFSLVRRRRRQFVQQAGHHVCHLVVIVLDPVLQDGDDKVVGGFGRAH